MVVEAYILGNATGRVMDTRHLRSGSSYTLHVQFKSSDYLKGHKHVVPVIYARPTCLTHTFPDETYLGNTFEVELTFNDRKKQRKQKHPREDYVDFEFRMPRSGELRGSLEVYYKGILIVWSGLTISSS